MPIVPNTSRVFTIGLDDHREIAFLDDTGNVVTLNDIGEPTVAPRHDPTYTTTLENQYAAKPPKLEPDHYYSRIWRGGHPEIMQRLGDRAARAESIVAASLVYDMLARTYRAIEPDLANGGTFSQDLRALLILACVEIESAWKGVLKAHNYVRADGRNWNVEDYYKLEVPLRLSAWKVTPRLFQKWGPIEPFSAWAGPRQKLLWYEAYHAVKHDGADKLKEASLTNTITAVAALDIMLDAQFGLDTTSEIGVPLTSRFLLRDYPKWRPEDGYYATPRGGQEWEHQATKVIYQF